MIPLGVTTTSATVNREQLSPWLAWLAAFEKLVQAGKDLRPVVQEAVPSASFSPQTGRVLLFAPHPDDEAIEAPLALRLQDAGATVTAVAVTLGSDKDRRKPRAHEFSLSCQTLGFRPLLATGASLAAFLREEMPDLIVVPHSRDRHPAHQKVHRQVTLAAKKHCLRTGKPLLLATTEYWQQMTSPNLLLGIRPIEAARVLAALACHAGETGRNPYHILLPGRWLDNVRRGAELVGGFGAFAPGFLFGEMYQILQMHDTGPQLSANRRIVTPEALLSTKTLEEIFFPATAGD